MSPETVVVDARRLLCPMPVIRLQDCINRLTAGARVEITCTDPGVMNDIPTWCRINGHRVISSQQQGHEFIMLVEKCLDGA
ncbi:MAG: sulfurtransferase TusA family protein [Gammaproteobacteria bacterium]|nr:sulfurtransferase TusA family protein [Gammaproteobacteria bacterium]